MAEPVKILFLCSGNSCRSRMAEGWANHLKKGKIESWSAGVAPKQVDSRAIKVMEEAGVDISGRQSKHVKDLMDVGFDYVITLCGHAKETCPLFPGKAKIIHHGFDDPPRLAKEAKSEQEALDHYRRVRDKIREYVENLPEHPGKE